MIYAKWKNVAKFGDILREKGVQNLTETFYKFLIGADMHDSSSQNTNESVWKDTLFI